MANVSVTVFVPALELLEEAEEEDELAELDDEED